jgi:hypothetical protein
VFLQNVVKKYFNMSLLNIIKHGLIQALEELMPSFEHRYCVKHLHANLNRKGFKGNEYKDALWGAARAPNEIQFKFYLEVIKGVHQGAYNYLEKVDPKMWSHHAFRPSS